MTTGGYKDHTWFLLAVGSLGLDFVAVHAHNKVKGALLETERAREHVRAAPWFTSPSQAPGPGSRDVQAGQGRKRGGGRNGEDDRGQGLGVVGRRWGLTSAGAINCP
ncbi:hypothetical protein CDD83_8013 [Cordyceps sp. RAO-2017]|nr:hypothetical protein CDD83_8013 [Cordyceps sp. RAO-2017]